MMMQISGKHSIEEMDGTRCSVVETSCDAARAEFLKQVLEGNGFSVKVQKNIPPPPKIKKDAPAEPAPTAQIPDTFKVGVTDLHFNLPVYLFGRMLRTPSGAVLSPAFWTQADAAFSGCYWDFGKTV